MVPQILQHCLDMLPPAWARHKPQDGSVFFLNGMCQLVILDNELPLRPFLGNGLPERTQPTLLVLQSLELSKSRHRLRVIHVHRVSVRTALAMGMNRDPGSNTKKPI